MPALFCIRTGLATTGLLSILLLGRLAAAEIPDAYRKLWSDPALTARLQRDIEQHRKGYAVLRVIDAAGRPVTNATVAVRQQSHAFFFGCNLFALDQLATPDLNRKYESAFTNLFNFATVPFYWRDLEPQEGQPRFAENSPRIWRRPPPDRLVNWCRQNGITPKGHALMYVKNMFMPDWTARNDAELLRRQGAQHMAELAKRYGREIPIWDAVNEEIPRVRHPQEWAAVPADFLPWCFAEADRLFPPETRLLLNDGTSEAHETTGEYASLVKGLQQQHARINGIGIQFHIYNRAAVLNGTSLPPTKLCTVYDQLGALGLPLYITEITVPGSGADGAELQAAIVANLYRLWFSTPHMAGVTWWNLGDGTAFQEENKALGGLLDDRMNPKPAYRALDHLINHEWKTSLAVTTDATGQARFRGFLGRYVMEVKVNGVAQQFPFELKGGGEPVQRTLQLR